MKKFFFAFLLLISAVGYCQNVYFNYPSNNDTYYSTNYFDGDVAGYAYFPYSIRTVSLYFLVDWYGARIKYQDPSTGVWGDWENWDSGQNGSFLLPKAGNYQIQGGVHVVADRGGYYNYFMYSDFQLTFSVVDTSAPFVPQGLSLSSESGTNYVKITWNSEGLMDLSNYEISRQVDEMRVDHGM